MWKHPHTKLFRLRSVWKCYPIHPQNTKLFPFGLFLSCNILVYSHHLQCFVLAFCLTTWCGHHKKVAFLPFDEAMSLHFWNKMTWRCMPFHVYVKRCAHGHVRGTWSLNEHGQGSLPAKRKDTPPTHTKLTDSYEFGEFGSRVRTRPWPSSTFTPKSEMLLVQGSVTSPGQCASRQNHPRLKQTE